MQYGGAPKAGCGAQCKAGVRSLGIRNKTHIPIVSSIMNMGYD